jgi:hypothetical protein
VICDLDLDGVEGQVFKVDIEVGARHFLVFACNDLGIDHTISFIVILVVLIGHLINHFDFIGT